MGLIVDIARTDYDAKQNAFHGKSRVTVLNIDWPFEPTPDAPAALLTQNALGGPIIVPAFIDELGNAQPVKRGGMIGPMFGGTFAASSDSRFGRATEQSGAISIHDRFESVAQYDALSR